MNFVTGNLIYKTAYNFAKDEIIKITYLGKSFNVSVDAIDADFIANILKAVGVAANKIIATGGYGSSVIDTVEIFFAYEGSLPNAAQSVDVWLQNTHHKFAGYATLNGIIIPAYMHIQKNLDVAVEKIAKAYVVKSFLVKPYSMKNLPTLILSKNPNNGVLADMRNIPGSHAFISAFKKLNWQRLWYQDPTGKQKMEVRPAKGW